MKDPPQVNSAAPTPPHPFEARTAARSLYWRGWSVQQISDELGLKYSTVAAWKNRLGWDTAPNHTRAGEITIERYNTLIAKESKTGHDFKEIDLLGRQMERQARIAKYSGDGGRETDLNPNIEARHSPQVNEKRAATKAAKGRNYLTDEQWDALEADFHEWCKDHQKKWWAVRHQRTRKIKKSRQLGATAYFSREAFLKGRESSLDGEPRNQIFLSASKRQALKFRRFIVAWVRRVTGVNLTGGLQDAPMTIDMGEDADGGGREPVEFHFLSTSKATAQGESGDFYFDEFFWVPGFKELKRVASAMATHTIYKRTYFSSASTVTHEAYPFWNGDEWNEGKRPEDKREFDVSKAALADGAIMPDGSWQQLVTIQMAIAGGMDEFLDEDELRQEYSEDEFRNLFECEEIDDTLSSFPHSLLGPAQVDSFYAWPDFKSAEQRPFGQKSVSLGYDPDKGGRDGAAVAVIAWPEKAGGKFRLLEKLALKGLDFEGQARELRRLSRKYNVTDIGIDTSGAGQAVHELVVKWFPTARRIDYSVSVKSAMVYKAQNVFRNKRFEYDAGWHDVTSAFMAIHPALTASGKQVTFVSGRSQAHGHANIAWAVLGSLINEPMDASEAGQKQSSVEFFQ